MGLKIIQSFIKNNPCYKNNTYKDKYGFMVHSTATPGAKANGFIDSWNKSSSSTAVEFIIDDTGVYQLLPLNIRSWHCGASGNNTHVGCEICQKNVGYYLLNGLHYIETIKTTPYGLLNGHSKN